MHCGEPRRLGRIPLISCVAALAAPTFCPTQHADTHTVNPVSPRSEDVVALIEVMPDDIRRVLINGDSTAAQLNLRLGPAPLSDDAILVAELNEDLAARIEALDLPAD